MINLNPFTNPFAMNLLIMGLYALNGIQYAWRGLLWDALYWLAAFLITASVTFRPH